jgi:WD40 repeat protein
LAFSADSRLFVTAGKDGTVKIWSPAAKPELPCITNWFAGEFSADGRSFVTLSDQNTDVSLDLWAVENPAVHTTRTLSATDQSDTVLSVLSRDGRFVALARKDRTVEVWSIDTGTRLNATPFSSHLVTSMAFSGDDLKLALGTAQGAINLWDLKTGITSPLGTPRNSRVTKLEFSPASHVLDATLQAGRLLVDLSSGTGSAVPVPGMPFVFSPDDRVLAAPDTNYVVKLWNLPGMTERAVLKGHRWSIASMAFSPDGKVFATGSLDAVARLWDPQTGAELTRPLRGHLQGVTHLAIAPDDRTLATGSTDGTVKLWQIPTGRELLSFADAGQPRFSPDGNTLLLKTSQGTRLIHVPALSARE